MEPPGGSAAAAPEVAPSAQTDQTTTHTHDATSVTSAGQDDEKDATSNEVCVEADVDTPSDSLLKSLVESVQEAHQAAQPASRPCLQPAIQPTLSEVATDATPRPSSPPVTQSALEVATQPDTQPSLQPTSELASQSTIKEEPTNAALSAATEALGTALLESLQSAFKRPRSEVEDDDRETDECADTKRVKLEPVLQPEPAISITSPLMPPTSAQDPVVIPTPSPAPTSDFISPAASAPAANIAPSEEAAAPFDIPPDMDLEAMLKSALGSMNHSFSPPNSAPATSAPSFSSAPHAAAIPVPAPTPVYQAKPTNPTSTYHTTPNTTTASSPAVQVAPLSSTAPPAPWKATTFSPPIVDQTSTRMEKTSPAASSGPARNQLVRASSQHESKKMRFSRHPTYISRSMALPLIGSFAVQLLYILGENPGPGLAHNGEASESELRGVYKALRAAFRHTRQIFSEAAILNNEELEIKEIGDQETIFMANMASIASSIFEADDLDLVEAHDHFLSSFLSEPDGLDKDLATLFLNLKYFTLGAELSKLSPDDRECRLFLERLFPFNLEGQLQNLHPDTPLTDYERRFMWDMKVAREQLFETAKKTDLRQVLQERYTRDGLRTELSAYLRANEDFVLRYAESHGIELPNDDEIASEDLNVFGDAADTSLMNGTDFAAMGDSIASMLSAAMASSENLLRPAPASAPTPSLESPSAPQAPKNTAMAIDSMPDDGSNRHTSELLPMAEDVGKLIQEAIQRSSEAGATPQPVTTTPYTTSPAKAASLLSTPSVRAHTSAPPPPVGTSAARSNLTESVMDLTGLTNLIKEKLGQDAHNAQAAVPAVHALSAPPPPPVSAPTLAAAQQLAPTPALGLGSARTTAPTPIAPAYKPNQASSPVAQANAALTSMQNTFANSLAMYNRGPAYAFQPLPPPPVSTPPLHSISNNANRNGLPPNQSLPSAVLYQQARHAAASKTQSHIRREGLHSTRRPWSPDEEQALMAGLDMVKGPHWSQILQLFGANGTISDILRDRSQVQLKDKARNLKLFFLKASTEMPYYLQCVTGELKTRAPSQAARKEAEERARANNQEEQARVQGIMTLAGGLQDNKGPAPVEAAASATAAPEQPLKSTPSFTHGAANSNVVATTNGSLPLGGPTTTAANGAVANGQNRINTSSAPNVAANPGTQTSLPPQSTGAKQQPAAVQSQTPQLQQSQGQPAQAPKLAPGTNTQATAAAGTSAASIPVTRAPLSAADIALSAARNGYTAAAQALSAQQSSSQAISRALAPGTSPAMSASPSSLSLLGTSTSASIRSVSAGITAGMTAAINNAISNAALAARPSSTPLMTTAQRLAAANRAAGAAAAAALGKNASLSPSAQKLQQQQQQQQQQQNRRLQGSPSPVRSQASQSPVSVAARQPLAQASAPQSPRAAAPAMLSPASLSVSAALNQRTPSPLQVTASPGFVASQTVTQATPLTVTLTAAPSASATAPATTSAVTATPATASAASKVLERSSVPVAPVVPQAGSQKAAPVVSTANGLTSSTGSNNPSATTAPHAAGSAAALATATGASATPPAVRHTAASLAPTTSLAVPVVKVPPPLLQPQPRKEQTVDASEESVLRRLLASSPS
ncbi:TTAGGG repeat binding factor [Sporothrix epigloea]|uniref:TTAGGG repeat binding factor n=1 Tax=Sporothrix epigloea TaxID=1892477 RepID=A0ABP0D7Q7_9PEZI